MTVELIDEIARRLGLSTDEVAPALDTVTERIRQQVAHYGYARLAHLGTFRSRDGSIVFEPEPALTERINARFAGLNELVLEPAESDPDIDEAAGPGAASDARDWAGTEETDDRPLNPWEGTEAPGDPDLYTHDATSTPAEDDRPLMDADGIEAGPEATGAEFDGVEAGPKSAGAEFDGVQEPDREPSDIEGVTEPERASAEMDGVTEPERDSSPGEGITAPDRPAEDVDAAESDADADEGSGAFWTDVERPASDHPLGPESEPSFEEADFSVLEAREDSSATGDEAQQPTVSWEPLGAAERETHAPGDKKGEPTSSDAVDREGSGDEPRSSVDDIDDARAGDEQADAAGDDSGEAGDAPAASSQRGMKDRSSTPGRMSSDGPVRTIRAPSRRSKSRRDMKPVWFGVGIIVIVAAAAIAYFTIPTPSSGPDQEPVVQSESMPPPSEDGESVLDDPDDAAADAPGDEPADAPETVPGDAESSVDAVETSLRSDEGINPAEGGFTIVVYSDTEAAPAEIILQEYQEEGYRAGLLTSEQDGVTRYRVGVGQFDTLDEAVQQRDDLAGSDLPGDAWILRL